MKKSILLFILLFTIGLPRLAQAAEQNDSIYLMAYFKGPSQHLFYALSEDGLHWEEANGGEPIFCAYDERIWMRDPFLQRVDKDGKTTFHLVHTWGWDNPAIFHWESDNLVDWKSVDGGRDTDSGKIYVMDGKDGRPASPNAWAPEFTYVPEEDTYYVYWSSRVDNRQLHYVTSTKDWISFTTPQVLFDPGITAIDLTVVPHNGKYYGFYKDERNGRKTILRAITTSLNPEVDTFKGVEEVFPSDFNVEVEGPSVFAKLDGSGWIGYVDEFNGDKGLIFAECDDLEQPWKIIPKDMIKNVPDVKHGSVIKISRKEAAALGRK
ncbi:MAG: glycoside hydrolase family 43 protein [Muribaculaceae bacterium]|nr:glycoside hydrolase family 43 protein [Muribaculaceae bacterium]